jgi:hypothetical protein
MTVSCGATASSVIEIQKEMSGTVQDLHVILDFGHWYVEVKANTKIDSFLYFIGAR